MCIQPAAFLALECKAPQVEVGAERWSAPELASRARPARTSSITSSTSRLDAAGGWAGGGRKAWMTEDSYQHTGRHEAETSGQGTTHARRTGAWPPATRRHVNTRKVTPATGQRGCRDELGNKTQGRRSELEPHPMLASRHVHEQETEAGLLS